MLIESQFEVPAPIDEVWAFFLDVEKVAPCMPGAQLTETVDERNWKGKVAIKLGPVSLSFAGAVTVQERDDEAHRVVLKAKGMETKGKGSAIAVGTSWLEPVDGGTRVNIKQDLTLSGAVAQYGRGMIQDVTARLTKEFADCLKANIELEEQGRAGRAAAGSGESTARPPARAVAGPVKGIRLALWALFRAVVRFFGRLFGRMTHRRASA